MSGPRRPGGRGNGRGRTRVGSPAARGDAPAARIAELRIESVTAGGDGVGRVDGMATFVPRAAPGDVVRALITPMGRFARGHLNAVLEPGPGRVDPPCPHYVDDRCGGCQLQHLAYGAQLDAKRRIVGDALQRIGRVGDADGYTASVVASPAEWRYRRKLTLALRRRLDGWIAGLHPYDAPGEVFAMRDCPITDQRVVDGWRAVMASSDALPDDTPELRGAVRLLGIDRDEARPSLAFTVEGGRRWRDAEAFFESVPSIDALWWSPEHGERQLLFDRTEAREPGASFVQVNPTLAPLLHARVLDTVRRYGPASVLDAYAGSGDLTVALAEFGIVVTAIELDGDAVRFAAERLTSVGGDAARHSRVLRGRVEAWIVDALPADVIVVNPPRAGLDAAVPAALERAAAGAFGVVPRAVLYVSCNPATLARDVARMPSYRLVRAEPFDMFPQTSHVETIAVLEPILADAPAPAQERQS